jgi:hypothetical protein
LRALLVCGDVVLKNGDARAFWDHELMWPYPHNIEHLVMVGVETTL